MKKFRILSLILALILLLGSVPVLATGDRTLSTMGCSGVNARIPLAGNAQLTETAKAVILYELNTDTMLYAWNADTQIDPTGMVKILTALVALECGKLDDMVTVKRSVLDSVTIGAVSADLKSNEVISVRELLYCVMVKSANDAAAVLADYLGGSQAAFVEMMNQKAVDLGCTGSNFTNVHGLNTTGQYSTARDLLIITRAALENPLFTEMFCLDNYTVPATNKSEERYYITSNYLMSDEYMKNYYDARVTGGKTAAATLTDRSVICTAEVGTARYLCIVMSAEAEVTEDGYTVIRFGSFDEAKVALDFAFRNFAVRQVVDTRQIFAQYAVSGGENDVTVSAAKDVYTVLPVDFSLDNLTFSTMVDADCLQAPVAAGDSVGTLQISYQNIVLGSCDLKANHAVAVEGSTIQKAPMLEAPVKTPINYKKILIWLAIILAAVLLVAGLTLVSIRVIRSARIRQQHKRRMRNRRRSR